MPVAGVTWLNCIDAQFNLQNVTYQVAFYNMEKNTAHCKLKVVKALIDANKVVYHTAANGYKLYVKLTVVGDLLIVSFKGK